MQQPSELLKSFANRLAGHAFSKDGFQLMRALRQTNLLGNISGGSSDKSNLDDIGHSKKTRGSNPANQDRIGIWEKRQENGQVYFARSIDKIEDWNYWANLGRIDAKGTKKRVVFLGESVARGYLYDPQFTCAMALEKILQSQLGKDEIEVIDLARTNMGLEVKDLALAALQLEPDVAVIFSGNNWRTAFPPSTSEIPKVGSTLREQGMGATKRIVDETLAADVKRAIRDVSSVYASKGVPLLWIIPEFNLGDWFDPLTYAPHLPGGGNLEWIKLWEDAQVAFQSGDFKGASDLAEKMVELDEQTNVAGLYILADCSKQFGDLDAARHYRELARDSVIWDSSKSAAPRTYTIAQQALREEAPKYQSQVLDLPKLFKEYLNGALPDRRLFLDYCHMTSEGIRVSMAAAAACVLRSLKYPELPWTKLINHAPAPAQEVEAEAAFLAAIHSGHWWQPYDVVRYFCGRAVQQSRHIATVMSCFIDMQVRRTPLLMCRSAEQVSGLGSPLIQHYLLRYNNQQLDRVLLDAVVDALKEVGVDSQEQLERLRLEEHSVANLAIDLLDYYYCSAGLQPQEVMWTLPKRDTFLPAERNHYYKAYCKESKFLFVGETRYPVHLELSCRLHQPPLASPTVSIRVNGSNVGSIDVDCDWTAWSITVPGALLQNGLNEIDVEWPMPDFPGLSGYDDVVDDLINGSKPEFFCIFGEIHTFTASNGSQVVLAAPETQQELSAIGAD